jgi:tetratricopeptide (TPR) repeat protein
MPHVKLFVLGQPRLGRGEAPIELNLRKALALLVYLAVTGQPHSREALATMLWPESDGREGRTRLRRTLHRLAQALGEDLLVADIDTIRLRTAKLWLDSTTFRQHVAAGLPAAPADVLAPERLAHLIGAIDDWEQVVTIQWQLADVNFRLGDRPAAFQHLRHMCDDYLQRGRPADAILALSRESYEALRYSDLSHARATRERSLDLARQTGDRFTVAWQVWEMGEIERVAGNYTAARLHYEQAHVLFADIPDRMTSWHVAQSTIFYHHGLGDIAYACGDPAAAEHHFQASLASARENDHDWSAAYALAGLARAELALQRPDEAREHLYEALTKAQKYGHRRDHDGCAHRYRGGVCRDRRA